MAGTKGRRMGGWGSCKICSHPGVEDINVMLLNGVNYDTIISRMKEAHPGAKVLLKSNITFHKKKHLFNRPITVETEDGQKQTYLSGAFLADRITVDGAAIPEPVAIPDALRVVIAAGVANILQNPSLVSPQMLISALDLARKMGLFTGDSQEFNDAWAALGAAHKTKERKRTRRVTVEETVEETDQDNEPEVVDHTYANETPALPELPNIWPASELSLVPLERDVT